MAPTVHKSPHDYRSHPRGRPHRAQPHVSKMVSDVTPPYLLPVRIHITRVCKKFQRITHQRRELEWVQAHGTGGSPTCQEDGPEPKLPGTRGPTRATYTRKTHYLLGIATWGLASDSRMFCEGLPQATARVQNRDDGAGTIAHDVPLDKHHVQPSSWLPVWKLSARHRRHNLSKQTCVFEFKAQMHVITFGIQEGAPWIFGRAEHGLAACSLELCLFERQTKADYSLCGLWIPQAPARDTPMR